MISTGAVMALLVAAFVFYLFPQKVLTVDSGPVPADAMVVLGGGFQEREKRAAGDSATAWRMRSCSSGTA